MHNGGGGGLAVTPMVSPSFTAVKGQRFPSSLRPPGNSCRPSAAAPLTAVPDQEALRQAIPPDTSESLMSALASQRLSAVHHTTMKPCIYRCRDCGHVEHLLLSEDFPQGGLFTCRACYFSVEVFDLDIGSPGLTIQWRARPANFKREQYLNVLRLWWSAHISTWQALRGFRYPATQVWFADQCGGSMVCVCPEILAMLSDVDR